MNEIYNLIGKIIKEFQELEEHLAILVYCHYYAKRGKRFEDIRRNALEQYAKIDSVTFGQKLGQMLDKKIMSKQDNDYWILDYLKEKRNYIAHNFFVENKFEEQSDIDKREKELAELLQQVQLVEKGYGRMMMSELQRLRII